MAPSHIGVDVTSPLFFPRERRRAIPFDCLAGKGPLYERRRIRKRTVHGRGMVEVGIETPFYARSRRASVLGQALLTGRRHIEVLAASAHEDRNRRLQCRIGHQRSRCDQWLRRILLETVLEGEALSDDLLLYGP